MEPGNTTTEFKIAKWMGIFGATMQPVAMSLAATFPDSKIVAIIVAIAGALIAIAGVLGYQIPRVALKKEVIRAEAAKVIAGSPVSEEQKKS